jgi:hypothetical protein
VFYKDREQTWRLLQIAICPNFTYYLSRIIGIEDNITAVTGTGLRCFSPSKNFSPV